jgi:hypothetical protein
MASYSIFVCVYIHKRLLFIPLMCTLDAFVKDTHGFIGTPDLHLHKIGLVVMAGRTCRCGSIDIVPGGSSSQYIIDTFQVDAGSHVARATVGNGTRIWAAGAIKDGILIFKISDLCQAR